MLQYILALLTFLVFVVLIFRKPQVETYVLFVLYAFPFLNLKLLPVYLGYIRVFDAISIVGLLVLFKYFISFSSPSKYSVYAILGILFCVFTIISGLQAEFGFENYFFYYPIFTTFIFVRFLFIFCRDRLHQWKVLDAFKIAYISALLFMTLQFIFGLEVTLTSDIGTNVFNEDTGVIRYQGIFGDSQFNGQFLAMGSFIFLILQQNISLKKRRLNYLGFAIAILYLFLAGSRSGMGGFLVGILFLFMLSSVRIKIYGITLGLTALAAIYLVAPDNAIFARADNLGNDFDFRQSIWEETYGIIQENPILGIGLGNFQDYTTKYNQSLYLEESPGVFTYFTQPENGYLKILTEHGVLAFTIFCFFFILPFSKIAKHVFWQSVNPNALYLVAALGSWLTAFNTVYSLSDYRILLTVALFLFYLIVVFSKKFGIPNNDLQKAVPQMSLGPTDKNKPLKNKFV